LRLGATVYTYSLILAAVLLGIGIGSYVGSLLTRAGLGPRTLLGVCQALLTAGIAWAAYQTMVVLPATQSDPGLASSVAATFRHDLTVSLLTVLPAALLWGASFPLALAAAERRSEDPGRFVGQVYAANTFGAIVGSLGTPLVAMALLGSQRVQQALILIAAASALLLLAPTARSAKPKNPSDAGRRWLGLLPIALALVLVWTVPPVPGPLIGYGPGSWAWRPEYGSFIYVGEGMNGSVAISRLVTGVLNYHNAGKVQASSEPGDLRLQRMLGHLTTLQQENPESVLVIGCGSGATAGAVCVDPRVKRLTIVEIEPLVPKAARRYFGEYNEGVLDDPKTTVVIDDGRHYLMTSDEKFDAITCDPFDPWTKGAAALSTVEFYQSVRDHLKPGGTVTVWVPLYQTRPETVRSEIATFLRVFPDAVVWDNVTGGAGDVVLSGRVDATPIDLDATEARLAQPEYARVRESLASIGFSSASDLFGTFGARGNDLRLWAAGAAINTDRNLRLQYLAGEGFVFSIDEAESIYADMTRLRTWPASMFTGSPERIDAVRAAAGF
jgi:spermidine synthase